MFQIILSMIMSEAEIMSEDFLPNHTSVKLLSYYRDHPNFLLDIFYPGK